MLRRARRLFGSLAAAAAMALALPAFADSGQLSPNCRSIRATVPGAVLGGQVLDPAINLLTGELNIAGRLCLPAKGAPAPKTVVFALHGITYTSEYWDAQYQPAQYSFVRAMNAAGYAVFTIDRLGYGRSSHPLSALVTLDVGARVAHELIGQLRQGRIGGVAFPYVALVGHSYGTATAWLESSIYNDADIVIGTGWANTIQSVPMARFFAGFYPAILDPKFMGSLYDPGYLTPMPGTRSSDFLYDLSNVDAAMLQYDQDVLRETVTGGEGVTFYNRYGAIPVASVPAIDEELQLALSSHVRDIAIPSFLINGRKDLLFCGPDTDHCASNQALYDAENAFFAPQACLRTAVTPAASHILNLQLNAQTSYATVREWLDRALGPTGAKRNSYRASCSGGAG